MEKITYECSDLFCTNQTENIGKMCIKHERPSCRECRRQFQKVKSWQKFCSDSCRNKFAYKKRECTSFAEYDELIEIKNTLVEEALREIEDLKKKRDIKKEESEIADKDCKEFSKIYQMKADYRWEVKEYIISILTKEGGFDEDKCKLILARFGDDESLIPQIKRDWDFLERQKEKY